MAQQFDGKVALVTGAASGIGRAVSLRLAAEGASVVVVDLNEQAATATAQEIVDAGGTAAPFVADVADPDRVAAAVAFAEDTYGKLNLAFNNAGITGPSGLLADIPVAEYQRTINVNMNAVFYGMHAEIPARLRAGGERSSTPRPSWAWSARPPRPRMSRRSTA
jgi:NAD(P)-dependent dehydrogenase (short-subunit alcohol dehydrogenase family)